MKTSTFLLMKTRLCQRTSFRTNLKRKKNNWLNSLFLRSTTCFVKEDGVTGPVKACPCLINKKISFNKKRRKEDSKLKRQNSREKTPCLRRSSSTKALQKILEIWWLKKCHMDMTTELNLTWSREIYLAETGTQKSFMSPLTNHE